MQRKTPMEPNPARSRSTACTPLPPLPIKANPEEPKVISESTRLYCADKDLDSEILQQLECELSPQTLRRLIGLFVAETRSHLANITAAQAAGDSQRLQREAHTLKSAAGSFGALRLRQHAWRLDRCCADGDWDGIHALAASITEVASPALHELTRQYLMPRDREARSEIRLSSSFNPQY